MSLYGPRIHLPKVNAPIPGNPSWNMDKEKKLAIYLIIAVIIIVILYFAIPIVAQALTTGIDGLMNPALVVTWKNNPLNVTTQTKEAEMDLVFTNTKKEVQNVEFSINTSSEEIVYICPNAIYDTNKGAYILENLAPGDKRTVPCVVRRNPNSAVFSGSYTINVHTNLGDVKTNLEIITK
jgi:hypothetical protein